MRKLERSIDTEKPLEFSLVCQSRNSHPCFSSYPNWTTSQVLSSIDSYFQSSLTFAEQFSQINLSYRARKDRNQCCELVSTKFSCVFKFSIDTGAPFHSRMIKGQFEKMPSSHDHVCKIFYIIFFGYVLIFTDCRHSLKAYAKQTVTHVHTLNRKMSHPSLNLRNAISYESLYKVNFTYSAI